MASVFPEPSARSVARLTPAGSIVAWLVHSKQESARQSRRLLNTWLEPLAQDAALLEKLFGDNRTFRAAFHQLYLAASLRQAQQGQGRYPVAATAVSPKAPGFNVAGDGDLLDILDAGGPQDAPGRDERMTTLLGEVERFDTPGFKVVVTAHAIGPLPVVADLLRQQITRWLATLAATDSPCGAGQYQYNAGGWSLTLEAIRIGPRWRATPARTTCSETAYAHQRDDELSLRCTLEAATVAHRQVRPYVLAAPERSFSGGPDPGRHQLMAWHRTNALFGTAGTVTDSPHDYSDVRLPDGFWRPLSPAHQQVSAVLLTDHLAPWNALRVSPELWINPAHIHPGVRVLPLWRHVQFCWTDGGRPEVQHIHASAVTAAQFWAPHESRSG